MKVTNIIINNVNDGLSANSLAPTGPWQENRQYKGSDGISHVVIVGLGDNPAKWDMTKAKYFYAKEDNVNKHPSQHPEVWGEVPYFEYLVAASALVGKINADQIEASAFIKKWMTLDENYTANDIYNLIKEGQNYYFILPKGDIRLPMITPDSEIPIGTEINFILPEQDRAQKRYFQGAVPLRANFDNAGVIDGVVTPGHAVVYNVCPIRAGVLHLQAVKGDRYADWLWTNWAEFRNFEMLDHIRDIDTKAQRYINRGECSVDASKVSTVHCEEDMTYKSTLNIFNAHYGNDITLIIPYWAWKVTSFTVVLFHGQSAERKRQLISIDSPGVYRLYFHDVNSASCYCVKLSDTFIDTQEITSDTTPEPLPPIDPWDLPNWTGKEHQDYS